jgi:DNA polymerase IV
MDVRRPITRTMNTENRLAVLETSLRWLFVDMNSFFASCEQQMNPDLRGQPIVVAPVLADTTCAIAASYEAKAFGIKTGTPIWEARKRCPAIKILQARPKLYVEYHHLIREAIETCIPVEAVMSIDEVACKLDRIQVQPPIAKALALAIKAAIRDRAGVALLCSVGIAANRLLAKLACDMQKPDGLTILRPEDMPQAIFHLKPNDIPGVGSNMLVRLNQAGILDMPQLWAADAQRLERIWGGVNGLRFHALLHGADLPNPKTKSHSMGHQHVLAPDERTLETAAPIIRQLCTRVAQRLRAEGFYCQKLGLNIKWVQDLGSYADECRFAETQDTHFLLTNLMHLWESAPKLKPLRIGVTISDLTPQGVHQPTLFDQPKDAKLTKAIDQVNARFGRNTLGFGTPKEPMTSKIAFQRVPKLNEM